VTETKFLEEREIEEYVNFLKQYYSISDLKLCVAEASESEWKLLYTEIRKGCIILENMVNEGKIKGDLHEVTESHRVPGEDDSYKNVMGYFIPTNNLVNIIGRLWKDSDATRTFKKVLEGTEFFIMLRKGYPYLREREGYLDTLFHEILHTIEIKSQKRIFRGSTAQQEACDTQEIVMPYVKLFMSARSAFYTFLK
jgi:hypothetical protein